MSPLTPIPLPQGAATAKEGRDLVKDVQMMAEEFDCGDDNNSESEALKIFDLMNIRITIYALSGVVCKASDKKKKNRRRSDVPRLKCNSLRNLPVHDGAVKPLEEIPTTVVVSCERNVTSSGTKIETYLPSSSLRKPEQGKSASIRQNATFPAAGSSLSSVMSEDASPSSFEVTRMMQRHTFLPDENMRQVANYVAETVDVKVGIARGHEMAQVAIVSIPVTGDEESETQILAPLKFLAPKKLRIARKRKNERKMMKDVSFKADPTYSYDVEENAVLRVGVHCFPAVANQDRQHLPITPGVTKKSETLDEILEGLFESENHIIEFSDENSLLDNMMAPGNVHLLHQNMRTSGEEVALTKQGPDRIAPSFLSSFLCGALDVPAATNQLKVETSETAANNTKTSAAVVLPLSLISSVSESTRRPKSIPSFHWGEKAEV